ncbi:MULTISPECIES: hypothetical protein [Bacillus]|uniref:hypothetical protein n=1 Tax=Bacillus TaxID=1386 RepID=UPI0011A8788B|nr:MULTISPECIES: hypothetical protein [Bacillus]QWS52503.1 hypothetical protein JNUCC24_19435 [Bacillus sp. JNUCC-24]
MNIVVADLFTTDRKHLKEIVFPKDINEPFDKAYQMRKHLKTDIIVRLIDDQGEKNETCFPYEWHNELDI